MVVAAEGLGGDAVVVACVQGAEIGVGDVRPAAELLRDEPLGGIQRPVVEPVDQPHREEVAAAIGLLGAQADLLDRQPREPGHVDLEDLVPANRAILQGIGLAAGQIQVPLAETIAVGDHDPAGPEVLEISDQCRGVHRHQARQPDRRA